MHWAVDNRWDCCWPVDQSERSRCLASACKPLFGIWGPVGVGLIITLNQSENCFICYLLHVAIIGIGHASSDNKPPTYSAQASSFTDPIYWIIYCSEKLWVNKTSSIFGVCHTWDDGTIQPFSFSYSSIELHFQNCSSVSCVTKCFQH